MPMQNVEEKVKQLIAKQVGVKHEFDVEPDAELENDLGMDSLDRAKLNLAIETEFEIVIYDDVAAEKKTVGELTAYVKGQVQP